MSGARGLAQKTITAMKEPKIGQVLGDAQGQPRALLYDDGRVFFLNLENPGMASARYVWGELLYPIPRKPISPETACTGRRGRKQK
jgi:hypothetical protein